MAEWTICGSHSQTPQEHRQRQQVHRKAHQPGMSNRHCSSQDGQIQLVPAPGSTADANRTPQVIPQGSLSGCSYTRQNQWGWERAHPDRRASSIKLKRPIPLTIWQRLSSQGTGSGHRLNLFTTICSTSFCLIRII